MPMNTNGPNSGTVNSGSPIERLKRLDNNNTLRATGSYSAAFAMAAAPIPIIAALITVAVYFVMVESEWSKLAAISGGTFIALLAWFVAALIFYRSTAVDRANTSSYQQIINRLYQLAAWNEIFECEQQNNSSRSQARENISNSMYAIKKKEVCTTFDAICSNLEKKKNSSWMWATGYVNIWRLIHRADEALIDVEPTKEVVRDALHDEMSIIGSKIDNRNDLLNKLRLAVTVLSEQGATYLNQQPPQRKDRKDLFNKSRLAVTVFSEQGAIYLNQQPPELEEMSPEGSHTSYDHHLPNGQSSGSHTQQIGSQAVAVSQGNHADNSAVHLDLEAQARTIIREVRFSLHQFRDDRWEKLVRVRNHLLRISLLTGWSIYLLVAFIIIIITKTELPMLEAATIFFLVGMIVSLFSRLYDQSKTDSSIDDFRLAAARLTAAPIFSGLAAVGGVLIVLKLAFLQTPAMFELNLANVVVAAVFGLTPGLFVTTFQKQADQYKADLKSTQAPTGEQEKILSSE